MLSDNPTNAEVASSRPGQNLGKVTRRMLIPSLIFIWTVASLTYEAQWDFNIIFRYYGWVFTAQVAFLIFFLPKINWLDLKSSFSNKKSI